MSKDAAIIDGLQEAERYEQGGDKVSAIRTVRNLLAQHGYHAGAVQAAMIWARCDGGSADSLYALANAYMKQGSYKDAQTGFQLSLKMDPERLDSYINLITCFEHDGDFENAFKVSQTALKIAPKNFKVQTLYNNLLYKMGLVDESIKHGKKLLAHWPKEPKLHSFIARAYDEIGDKEAAGQHLKKALRQHPQDLGLNVTQLLHLIGGPEHEAIAAQIRKTHDLFKRNDHLSKMYQNDWASIEYMKAVADNIPLNDKGKILNLMHMERLDGSPAPLRLEDKSHPVWLYRGSDIKCFTTDWSFYDEENLYSNLKVTGAPLVFLMSFGISNRAYIEEGFPTVTFDEPGILLGGVANYYHWLVDFLPRLAITQFHPELRDMPFYVNQDLQKYQKESLAQLGISESRLRIVPAHHIATFKDLYIPYLPGRPLTHHGELDLKGKNENYFSLNWLRETFLKDLDVSPKKRLFISRATANFRRCTNEAQIFAIAQEFGFEKLTNEQMSFIEQVKLYSQVDVLTGPHGAGFTNMVFADKRAGLLELMPRGRNMLFFSDLTQMLGQDYQRLYGTILRLPSDKKAEFADFHIDADEFRTTIAGLCY